MKKKFLNPPKHAFDINSQREVVKHLNALKNGKIVDLKGKVIGDIYYADGNTVWSLQSSGGIQWQSPNKELDPTVSVSANTLVYLSPQNPLCTVGLVDLVAGTTLRATAGVWLCMKDCPAKTSSGYNVPQDPIPGYNISAPSGTPLKGDADGTNVYWMLIKSAC